MIAGTLWLLLHVFLFAGTGQIGVSSFKTLRTMAPILTSIVWLTSGTTYALGKPEIAWKDEYFRKEYLGPAA